MKVLLIDAPAFFKTDRAHIFIDDIKASDIFQYLPKCVQLFPNLIILLFTGFDDLHLRKPVFLCKLYGSRHHHLGH